MMPPSIRRALGRRTSRTARVDSRRVQALRRDAGFSLVETLIALAIVGLVLLFGLGLYWQQVRVGERLTAHRLASAALESNYERLRAGALPLVDGVVETSPEFDLVVTLNEAPGTVPKSRRAELVATYRVRGEPFRRSLVALLYVRDLP